MTDQQDWSFREAFFLDGGSLKVDRSRLQTLIQRNPEQAVAVAYKLLAQLDTPGAPAAVRLFGQLYSSLFNDDSLEMHIEQVMAQNGYPPPETESGETKGVLHTVTISGRDLAKCDTYKVIRYFGGGNIPHEQLRALDGSCALVFSVEEDEREITMIPEVRAYVRSLHGAFPGFAYYLDFDPRLGMFLAWFGCLAEPAALSSGGTTLQIMHPSVLKALGESLSGIDSHAARIGASSSTAKGLILQTMSRRA